jgi:transposase
MRHWFDKIANFHVARVANGPTEALNNLIKRIKRVGFGFRNFESYAGSGRCSTPANRTGAH